MIHQPSTAVADYKKCIECQVARQRFEEFSPLHGHCRRHTRFKPACGACQEARNDPKRQPLCKGCTRARRARDTCFRRLRRIVRAAGHPDETLTAADSYCRAVRVHGARHLPMALVAELRRTAGPHVRLEWDLVPPVAAPDLFAVVRPSVEGTRPPRAATYAPLYDLAAAAGPFGESAMPEPQGFTDTGAPTTADDFVIAVLGRSMEPTIQSGSWCVFRREATGRHQQGRVVLAQLREAGDLEYGGRYTVKRLYLPAGGRRSARTPRLVPDNHEHAAIPFDPARVTILGVYRRALASA